MNFKIYQPEPIIWDPKEDITTYELAMCLPLFVSTGHIHHYYDQLPSEAQRHWRTVAG